MAKGSGRKRLGELLLEANLLDEARLEQALQEQGEGRGRLGSLLIKKGWVTEEDVLGCLSAQLRIPSVDLRTLDISPLAMALVPREKALKHGIVPVRVDHDITGRRSLTLAMADPTDLEVVAALEFELNLAVKPMVATESSILPAIQKYYFRPGDSPTDRYRLHGWAAIDYADEFGGNLRAYSWEPGQADSSLNSEDAKRVARKRPWWVYLDATLCESCLAEGEIRRADTLREGGLPVCVMCAEASVQ